MIVDGDVLEKTARLFYLGDFINSEEEVYDVVIPKIRSKWKIFNDKTSVQRQKNERIYSVKKQTLCWFGPLERMDAKEL